MKRFTLSAFVCFLLLSSGCRSLSDKPFIAVNLEGYHADETKQALLVNADADTFEIVPADDSVVVYRGAVDSLSRADSSTGDRTAVIDFSGFSGTGDYIIRIKGNRDITSEPFPVGRDFYTRATLAAVQSYYYNRCGTGIDNGSRWERPVCHTDDAVFYGDTAKKRGLTGGWHDAGDHGKFSINTELSAGLLLYLFELRPELFRDGQLDTPAAGNEVPDLLDEVRWALKWLLKMQKNDGGVFHKVSQKKWVGEFLPHEDPERRYLFQVSSNATAGFAAVAALGARIYKPYDRAFAVRLEEAAKRAWKYLGEHPSIQPSGGFSNPPDVKGGEYSDDSDRDVRLWAAVELYKLTADRRYLDYFTENYRVLLDGELPPLSWKEFHSLALSAFAAVPLPGGYDRHQQNILRRFEAEADKLLRRRENNSYRTLLQSNEYYWGSASANLGYAYLLIQLYRHNGVEKYYRAALDQLHYTLGRNPFNRTFITGVGSRSVESPHHQFSMVSENSMPVRGMMVGGPNNHRVLQGRGEISPWPGKNYEDDEQNFFVNEVAINYTAIFAYTAGYFTSVNQEDKSTYEVEQ